MRDEHIWQDEALCAETAPDFFFPEDDDGGRVSRLAKQICAACPVREICLNYAQDNMITEGIFGGLSPIQRRLLRTHERETAA